MSTDTSQNIPPQLVGFRHPKRPSTPPSGLPDHELPGNPQFITAPPSPPLPPSLSSLPPSLHRPAPAVVLEAACAAGRLQEVHQILLQYLLEPGHGPHPITGQLNLGIFGSALAEAITHEQPHVVSYLFNMRVGRPSEFISSACQASSASIFQVFLHYGWDINQPVGRLDPPALG
jgi:hypothetical protein